MAGKKAEMWFSDYQKMSALISELKKSFIRDKVNISV